MKPLVVIPARMSATRLPGKPLADIHGEPMIVHVWRRALAARVGPVLVAAGDVEIVDAVESAGGRALLTRPDHLSGSDRVWEAVEIADPHGHHDVIVNLQGDLPMLDIVNAGFFSPTKTLDAQLDLLKQAPRGLKTGARIRFYNTTQEAIGRITILGSNTLAPGEEAYVQLRLEQPMIVQHGDRYILRLLAHGDPRRRHGPEPAYTAA